MHLPESLLKRFNDVIVSAYTDPEQLGLMLQEQEQNLAVVAGTSGTHPEIVKRLLENACGGRWIERLVEAVKKRCAHDGDSLIVCQEVLTAAAEWRNRAPDGFSEAHLAELLDFMVNKYDKSEDVDATLSRLSYSHKGRWRRGSLREDYRDLIDFAAKSGWDRLLAFALFCDRWTASGVPKLAERLLLRDELDGIRLFVTLNQIEMSDEQAARFYRQSITERSFKPHYPGKVTTMYVAFAIAKAQDAVHVSDPSGTDASAFPLQSFLEHVGSVGPEAEAQVLFNWQHLPGELSIRREGEEETFSVIVELHDSSTWTREKPSWNRRAWLYHHRSKKHDRLDDHLDDKPETLATITSYLNALRKRLAFWRIGPDRILIEIFLSRRNLPQAIDQWRILLDGDIPIQIGFENPVVLRSIDRDHKLRSKLEARWQKLHNVKELTGNLVRKPAGGNLAELYKEFARRDDFLCLVLESHLGPDQDIEVEYPCVRAAITAGLPIIIWAREQSAVQRLEAQLAELLRNIPLRLPDAIYQVRRNDTDLGPYLTLFFENANHWLPDDTQAVEART